MIENSKVALSDIETLIKSDPEPAISRLREILAGDPLNASAYRLLGSALDEAARLNDGRGVVRTTVRASDPAIARAAQALNANDLETAEIILRERLLDRPREVEALYLLAKLAEALDFELEAENLLRFALEIAPGFTPAQLQLAYVLDKRHLPLEACKQLEPVLAREPDNHAAKALKAAALGRAGLLDQAARLYEEMLQVMPGEPKLWTSYGHVLKTMGQSDEGFRAMRHAVDVAPQSGEAWWNLANLKTRDFSEHDIAAMNSALGSAAATDHDRFHLHFALGKAFEDLGDAHRAFAHYDQGNSIRRRSMPYSPDLVTADVDDSIRFFSSEFFESRTGFGANESDPIFVLGMPRAGSTLIEQILGSHPLIEGTTELPDIPLIARGLGRGGPQYFSSVEALDTGEARQVGKRYLEQTRLRRMTGKPFFVDKMPNNWGHVPLIHLLLPNAKIIDARRHPLACGFSNFKQLYVGGHSFSYDLPSIGRYYSDYVRFMEHINTVLPGRVHRVIHERLVDDTEGEIRRMLNFLGLPFDEACLRFYDTERAVRTPSSEQVRRPISRAGLDHWRMFEPWLAPLKDALGPVLDSYPSAPNFRPI
jgi:tetratricopeptide (TPR) repeat protein